MPQPIYNIILAAGLDPNEIGSIKETIINKDKIKRAFRQKWEDGDITNQDIFDNLIDYDEAPEWIVNSIEDERNFIYQTIIK